MSLIWTGARPVWADGGAMVTDALWLAASGRSKGTAGTERALFTLTWVDVILARLCKKREPGWITHEPTWTNWILLNTFGLWAHKNMRLSLVKTTINTIQYRFKIKGRTIIFNYPCPQITDKPQMPRHFFIFIFVFTHRQDFSLCDVPEALPEMDVQVLGDAFKFCPSQLGVDGILPRGE